MTDITDRGKAPIEALVRGALPTYDYRAMYRARVVSQSSDKKKVDVQPINADLPGLKAELVVFGPKATVTVAANTNVLLSWDGGDPSKPIALLFFADAGTKKVARKGDGAGGGTLAVAFVPGTGGASLTLTYTPGDGSAVQNVSGTGGNLSIKEKITTGSDTLEID